MPAESLAPPPPTGATNRARVARRGPGQFRAGGKPSASYLDLEKQLGGPQPDEVRRMLSAHSARLSACTTGSEASASASKTPWPLAGD
jgi:hypothetical protein